MNEYFGLTVFLVATVAVWIFVAGFLMYRFPCGPEAPTEQQSLPLFTAFALWPIAWPGLLGAWLANYLRGTNDKKNDA